MQKKFCFNYFYFGFFLLLLLLLSFLSLPLTKGSLLFFGEALCQSLLETLLLLAITKWFEKKSPFFYKFWIVFLFFLPLLYIINFLLLSLMDAPISHGVHIFLGQGMGKFLVSLRATNINTPTLILILFALLLLPFVALFIDHWTKKMSERKPLWVSSSFLIKLFAVCFFSLFVFEGAIRFSFSASSHFSNERRLPWGTTLFSSPPLSQVTLPSPLKTPRVRDRLLSCEKKEHLPNIYLFVVESLRRDAITEKTASNLFSFQKQNISLPLSFSSANFSPISWFAIFHGIFPLYWRENLEQKGSLCLQLLKKLGYKIHLFSSAELEYFQMDQSIFGDNHALADEYAVISQEYPAPKRDAEALSLLQSALSSPENKEGQLFVLFLDSTHSEYSWPKNFETPFFPFSEDIPYLTLSQTKSTLPLVKNRYYNALHYIDHLFGSFLDSLKQKNLFDSSIIVFTADHGEEFFEQGALFHGTHLNNPQTCVPIFYKFPENNLQIQTEMTSHVDIFPTLLHFVTKETTFASLFDGISLFAPHPWPYILTVQQNGGEAPYVFSLLHKKGRMIGNLEKEIFSSKKFEMTSLKNLQDIEIEENNPDFQELREQFSTALQNLLQPSPQ